MATKVKMSEEELTEDMAKSPAKYSNEDMLLHYFKVRQRRLGLEKAEEGIKAVAVDILEKRGGTFRGKTADYELAVTVSHPVSYGKAIKALRTKLTKKMQEVCDNIIEENTGQSTKKTPKMIMK